MFRLRLLPDIVERVPGWIFASLIIAAVAGVSDRAHAHRQQALIDEIIRKAENNEASGRFCSTTKWPNGDGERAYVAYLESATVGSWKVNVFTSGKCSYDRVLGVHVDNDGKCIIYKTWACDRTDCGVIPAMIGCLARNGSLVMRDALPD
jgi:hypothetical protein